MPKTAFTAKPATSRTRCRTSTGSFLKAAEAPITRTCNLVPLALSALVIATPATASITPTTPERAYIAARAASISGDHAGAAQLYARIAAGSADADLKQKAISEAISAGDMALALRLIRQSPSSTIDSRLLLVADALKRRQDDQAIQLLANGGTGADLSFWQPLVRAWNAAERKDSAGALAILGRIPRNNALGPFVDEQSALILLKLGRTAEAEPFARRAIGSAGAREYRVRLALAGGFAAAGDKARALAMLDGIQGDTSIVRQALEQGQLKSVVIDNVAEAFSEQLVALALEMRRSPNRAGTPVNIVQIAHYAAPENSSATLLLGNFLSAQDRVGEALAIFRLVPAGDPLKPEALDSEVRTLIDAKRFDEALAVAARAARSSPTSDDFSRLADAYSSMDRYGEAADAYGQAVARAPGGAGARIWPLLLMQASALESAGRWPEAKAVLSRALASAPNEPLVLNFLGYAKLEHGEDLDTAEALIRKASELAPDDASITDSLGWALYKRGRLEEAIEVLERAALGDPAQAEIHEHLGDALYAAGRRFEARFAWQAALATADEEETARITRKMESGLTQATAAP